MIRARSGQGWVLAATLWLGPSLATFAGVDGGDPAPASGGEAVPGRIADSVLDGYTGSYRLGDTAVLTVTRRGSQLSAQLTGQPAAEIYPDSLAEFHYKIVPARISFKLDDQGRADALVLHQNGVDHLAPRIDEGTAQVINERLASRIQAQTPTPGSEAALRSLIEGQVAGHPDYAAMSPALAAAVREQLPRAALLFKKLGALQSITFRGVGNQGWDIFTVTFEHGVAEYRIALSEAGIVTGALMTMGP